MNSKKIEISNPPTLPVSSRSILDTTGRKVVFIILLCISLATFAPIWFFLWIFLTMVAGVGFDYFIVPSSFFISLVSLIAGIFLGAKKHIIFLALPHVVTILWFNLIFLVFGD